MMKSNPLERDFQKKVVKFFRQRNAVVLNFIGNAYQKDIPDLYVGHAYWRGFIELKVGEYKCSDGQKLNIRELNRTGTTALVWRQRGTAFIAESEDGELYTITGSIDMLWAWLSTEGNQRIENHYSMRGNP